MKKLLQFKSEDTEPIVVEIEMPEDEYGQQEVSRDGKLIETGKSFQAALATIKPVAEAIISKFSELSKRPQEIDVEFGLKMSADAGAIIASCGVESNFKVTLKWKQE
ncbi:MAG: hypothetical protein DRI57_10885 [Deltaproteobacteria bacterium]|nr:MAG: hypothetical protein DRI57_10885 [Deltaproteobacteria bacterium]